MRRALLLLLLGCGEVAVRPAPPPPPTSVASAPPTSSADGDVPPELAAPPPPPAAEPERPPPRLPVITRRTTDAGMQLAIASIPNAKHFRATLVIDAGALDDRPGVAQLVAAQLEEVASEPEIAVSEHRITISLSATDALEAIDRLGALVTPPKLPHGTFNRVRGAAMERAESWSRDKPEEVTRELLTRVLLGAGESTSRRAMIATRSELSRIRRQHVDAFYGTHFHTQRAWLLLVGPPMPAKLSARVDSAFSALVGRSKATLKPTPPRAASLSGPPKDRVFLIETPKAKEATVIAVRFAPVLKDLAQLFVVAEASHEASFAALGPGAIAWTAHPATLTNAVQVAKDARSLDALKLAGVERAKQRLATGIPLLGADPNGTASWLQTVTARGLPDALGRDWGKRILAVDSAGAQQWVESMPPTRLFVVFGDGDVLAEPLRALGEVRVVNPRRGFAVRRTLSAL